MSSHFESWNAYWAFSHALSRGPRFLHNEQVTSFLSAIRASTKKRSIIISQGTALWRAQIGHDWRPLSLDGVDYREPSPYKPERMKPLRSSAHEGRVNPRGIPCLYVADNKETAVAEVRPWLGALVSVAQMGMDRPLNLIDCCDKLAADVDLYFEEPEPAERELYVWREIGRAFSKPANPDPGIAEYVPTQVLAEVFRQQGYDGILYQSRLGDGRNIALFDLDVLQIIDCRLYPVSAVRCKLGEMQDYVLK